MIKTWIKICMCAMVAVSLVACGTKQEFTEKEISATEFKEKIDNKESFVIMLERDNCPYCEAIDEYIEQTKQEHDGVTLYMLDVTDFELSRESEDATTLISTSEDGQLLLEVVPYFLYTPTIYRVKDGNVEMAGIGFDDVEKTVSQWGVNSTIDFDVADSVDLWEFIESK